MSNIPSLADLQRYQVNRSGEFEAIDGSLYDFQTYAATGQTALNFFQIPVGQSGKTEADTNMETAGTLPNPKHFLVESIEVLFYPGLDIVTDVTTVAESEFANDVYTVAKSGYLDFHIGSKSYLREAPIGRFPASTGLTVEGAQAIAIDAQAAATTYQVSADYARFAGAVYRLKAPILLQPTQNFKVSLNWPTAVALPSNTAARIGVVLKGLLYRESQ